MPEGTVALRICQEGHANALALNKDSTQIAVAGRSCELNTKYVFERNLNAELSKDSIKFRFFYFIHAICSQY